MNIDNVYDNRIHDVASNNDELAKFMMKCAEKDIEFNPMYKDNTNERGMPYISLLFNEKNMPLIYAIVAILRLEGYEFSFDKLNDKESAFSVVDVLNRTEDTKLFERLNELIDTYDVSKNYYYELPTDLQKYFDICTYAHGDNQLISNEDKMLQFKYLKDEEGHKYTLKTEDERYLQTADLSDFTLSADELSSYEIVSDNNDEIAGKLDNFDNSIQKSENLSENEGGTTGSGQEEELDQKEEKVVVEEKKQEEEEKKEDFDKKEEDKKEEEEDKKEEEQEEKNPLVDEEKEVKLDESALMTEQGKFVDMSQKEELNNTVENTPQIDMSEINRMIYVEQEKIEAEEVMRL